MKWVLLVCAVVACLVGVGFAKLWLDRFGSGQSYSGTCTAAAVRDGQSLEFEGMCSDLWPRLVEVRTSVPITGFSAEISTERDVLLFGGGGPRCERAGSNRIRCEGEVDEGERFAGRVLLDGDPCDADARLKVSGGGCSQRAQSCDDVGLTDSRRLQPEGC